MLKFALKKSCLDFMSRWIMPEQLMQEQEPEDDLLAKLFGDDGEDAMDRIIEQFAEEDSDGRE